MANSGHMRRTLPLPQGPPRGARSRPPARRWLARLVVEALEDRRLLNAGPPLFDAPWRAFDTGVYPQISPVAIAAGDLDGDGDADVVVGRDFTGSFSNPTPGVSVLKNRGRGTYDPPVHYDLPAPPAQPVSEVALADLDGNGSLDVVEALEGRCLLSGGRPLFDAPWRSFATGTFTEGFGPVALAVGDLNNDGAADVVVAQWYAGSPGISVLNGRGDRTFAPPIYYSLPRVHVSRITDPRTLGGKAILRIGGSKAGWSLPPRRSDGTARPFCADSTKGGHSHG